MINNVVLIGRICNDLELKTTTNGVSIVGFTLAVDRNYKSKNGEKLTDFIKIVAFKKTAEFVTRYFRKGSMIAVQGFIQTRNYEDKKGNKRTAVEIVANQVSFCGSKNENNGSGQENNTTNSNYSGNPSSSDDFEMIDGDDELPF